ncbi:MAG: DUF2256 domain-containing protein [Gemmataceae bacterium]
MKGRSKQRHDWPEKVCPVCLRPFQWRKRWKNCWDQVVYCSQRCRNSRNQRGRDR